MEKFAIAEKTFPDAPEELREAADEIVLSVSEAIGKMR